MPLDVKDLNRASMGAGIGFYLAVPVSRRFVGGYIKHGKKSEFLSAFCRSKAVFNNISGVTSAVLQVGSFQEGNGLCADLEIRFDRKESDIAFLSDPAAVEAFEMLDPFMAVPFNYRVGFVKSR